MKASRLLLKIYGEQSEGQWSLLCLDFSLAAQADTLEEAQAKLKDQIKEYLHDALDGQDAAHAPQLLSRRAPLIYWAKWWYGIVKTSIVGINDPRHRIFRQSLPLVPA